MIPTWAVVVGSLCLIVVLFVVSRYFSLWLQAYVSNTRVGILALVLMSLRRVDPRLVVQCRVMAVQAGLTDIPAKLLEAQILAGGDVERITVALIAAHRAGIQLDWNTASAIDLAGRDILAAVQLSVNPRVIDCPDPDAGRGTTLYCVAKDGIQLKVRVRVTVRTNVAQLVGGATEATIVARVGQGIVSAIGMCGSYRDALSDPQVIARHVQAEGLDSQTAFEIVSIDIVEINVGANIGAQLCTDQATADIRIARASAEKRRAMAIAREQEMIALTVENEAAVVLAEVEVPLAIADAFRSGNLSPSAKGGSFVRGPAPHLTSIVHPKAMIAGP
jgi:uncharacterized protein YqfA (UPF0365 family)